MGKFITFPSFVSRQLFKKPYHEAIIRDDMVGIYSFTEIVGSIFSRCKEIDELMKCIDEAILRHRILPSTPHRILPSTPAFNTCTLFTGFRFGISRIYNKFTSYTYTSPGLPQNSQNKKQSIVLCSNLARLWPSLVSSLLSPSSMLSVT